MDPPTLESDLDFAFNLQLQEALAASLAYQTPASSSTAAASSSSVPRQAHQRFRQERQIFELSQEDDVSEIEMLRSRELASKIQEIFSEMLDTSAQKAPDEDWIEWGHDFDEPFGEGCSSSKAVKNQGLYRLYFKGLVSDECVGGKRSVLGGIGIALSDSRDNLIYEEKKPLLGNGASKIGAEVNALIEGLGAAIALGLKRVVFCCDYYPLFQFVTRRWPPKQRKIAIQLNQVALLQLRFEFCKPKLVARHDVKFAFKLAREAISSQITRNKDVDEDKKLYESCVICLEDYDVNKIFSVDGCSHRYCFSCMKQHVEVKLLQGMLPKCPHEGCKFDLNVDSCAKFLTDKDIATMRQRIKEASIPASEKVYCSYPKCSALMTKNEVLEYTRDVLGDANKSGVRKCMKCHGLFCINCKIPWHSHISCDDYKRSHNLPSEEVKLKSLASKNLWRQCVKCSHMIELAEGCYHMTCRCGYEFCYNCGAEWKDKKRSCSCPLWDEDRILFGNDDDDGGFEEDEDEDEFSDFDDDHFYYYL